MHEVLFRGKETDSSEWIEGFYCPCCFGAFPCESAIVSISEGCWASTKIDPATVGQYIGLCDKCGNKIFEGDIIGIDFDACGGLEYYEPAYTGYAVVFYSEERFGWYARFLDNEEELSMWEYDDPTTVQVVGNIFDNPEYLHGKGIKQHE